MTQERFHIENIEFEIIDCDDSKCRIKFDINEGAAFSKERRKIYIIHDNEEVLYVGEANCSIKERFQRSLVSFNHFVTKGVARGGYKGYKWLNKTINLTRRLTATVVVFGAQFDDADKRGYIEAIEGELVFLVRKELGYWPKFQNEIHFQNQDMAGVIALTIFEELISYQRIEKNKGLRNNKTIVG